MRSAATCRSRVPTGSVPNTTSTASWTSTLTTNLINELTYNYSKDDVFINVFTGRRRATSAAPKASTTRTSSRRRKSSTRFRRCRSAAADSARWTAGRTRRRRAGPIHTFANVTTWVKGRHTFKARRPGRVLGRRRLRPDQRQRHPRQHEQPERPVRVHRQPHRRHERGDRQRGPRPLQQLRRARPAQLHRVAVARHGRLRAGFVEADQPDDDRRRGPVGAVAAVVLDDQQHRQLRSGVLRSGPGADRQPVQRHADRRQPLQRHRPAGRRLRRRRRRGAALERQRALPRRAARLLGHALQRVRAAARRHLSAEREDDPPPQRRHLPLPRDAERLDAAWRQPAVPAAGHRLQRPGGQPGRRHRQRLVALRHQRPGCRVQAPDGVHVGPRHPARNPVRHHAGGELPRAPRPLPAARAEHQPAAARRASGQPRRQHRGAAPLHGLQRHPADGELRQVALQQPADQRRPPLPERPEAWLRLHPRQVRGQREQQAQRCSGTPTTTR